MLKKYTYNKKVEIMYEVIEANRKRGGITYGELVEILTVMFGYKYNRSNNPIIKRLLKRNKTMENPYKIDEALLHNAKKVNFISPVVIPSHLKHEYLRKKKERLQNGLDEQLIKMLDALHKLINQNRNRGITRKEAELFLREIFNQKSLKIEKVICFGKFSNKPIERKSFVKNPNKMLIVIPNEYKKKYDTNIENDIMQNNEISLANIINSKNEYIVKLFLDIKLMRAEYLERLYKNNSQDIFDNIIKDIISEYGASFKICIFEDDIYQLDETKSDKINFNILKFISSSKNVEFIRQTRPNNAMDIIEFCKENDIIIVSGDEKILAYAMLENVRTYIPKEYIRQTPNPLKGKGLVVLDSNIGSENEIIRICNKFGSIAMSTIQLKEVGRKGYLTRICAYYGTIKKAPDLIAKSKDRTIVEFCKQIHADMFFSKDYGCIAFAKMQGVPCAFVENKNHSKSTGVELIEQAKNQNEGISKKICYYEGKEIILDLLTTYKMKNGKSRIVINNFCIEFKNSMYKNCKEIENGGYIFIKNNNFVLQIKVIDKDNKQGKIISARKL